jgi:hypothetical protein
MVGMTDIPSFRIRDLTGTVKFQSEGVTATYEMSGTGHTLLEARRYL